MAYEDKTPDTLSDIALYAGYAADYIVGAQELLRKYAGFLGSDGQFLRDAADLLGNAIHDEIDPALHLASQALESGIPQAIHLAGCKASDIELARAL